MPYDSEMVTGLASTDGAEVQDAVEHIMQVRQDLVQMKILLFTALVMTLEVVVLPPANPLRLQIVSFITSQSATATSSSAQKQSPLELWRISPDSGDASIVNMVLELLPNWTYGSPLEFQLYGYAHWAWYCFLLPGIVGPLLVMKSMNYADSFMLSAFLSGLGMICIVWKSSSSSGQHDKDWQFLMRQAVLRAEAPWDGQWLALSPRDLSPPKLSKPQPQSDQTALVPKLSGASSELHPIQEDDEDDRTDSILAEQNALLSQIDPAEMFETLTKLQGFLADADDVSDETRHKVQLGLDFLAATAQDDQRMN
ncbi:unnamed protein product [Aphanomyces euteiches]